MALSKVSDDAYTHLNLFTALLNTTAFCDSLSIDTQARLSYIRTQNRVLMRIKDEGEIKDVCTDCFCGIFVRDVFIFNSLGRRCPESHC